MSWLDQHLSELFVAGGAGLVTFLVKHYFDRLHQDIARVGQSLAKLDGKLEVLQADIRTNSIELTRAVSELRAIWRWIDAKPRATDNGGLHGP